MERFYQQIQICSLVLFCFIEPVSATAEKTIHLYPNYFAYYKIISNIGHKELGYYNVGIKKLEGTNPVTYRLFSEIRFSYPTSLISQSHYIYNDEVFYDQYGVKKLHIELQHDKDEFLIVGERVPPNQDLLLQKYQLGTDNLIDKKQFPQADFDYTLFALRFPQLCENSDENITYHKRFLDVINWKISQGISHYINKNERKPYMPPFSWPNIENACLYISNIGQEPARVAWMSPGGYLIYEKNKDYVLQLVEEKSTLPEKIGKFIQ